MTCTPNYPTTIPVECLTSLVSILRSGNIAASIKELCAAAYQIEGYALQVVVGPPAVINGPPPVDAEHRALLQEARTLLSDQLEGAMPQPPEVGSQLTVFWHTVLAPMLARLLAQLLASLS